MLVGVALVLAVVLIVSVRTSWLAARIQVGDNREARVMAALESFRPAGWSTDVLPLGETELVQQKVLETLNFDQAVFLRFRRGLKEFAVYLAYWSPNKATARDVRLHTPDTCWVQAGWQEKARNEAYVVPVGGAQSDAGQYRKYEQRGFTQHVVFWHFMNSQLVQHWRYGQPSPQQVLQAIGGKSDAVKGEQYFLRISSPEPVDWLWEDEVGKQLMRLLLPMGLVPEKTPQTSRL